MQCLFQFPIDSSVKSSVWRVEFLICSLFVKLHHQFILFVDFICISFVFSYLYLGENVGNITEGCILTRSICNFLKTSSTGDELLEIHRWMKRGCVQTTGGRFRLLKCGK